MTVNLHFIVSNTQLIFTNTFIRLDTEAKYGTRKRFGSGEEK